MYSYFKACRFLWTDTCERCRKALTSTINSATDSHQHCVVPPPPPYTDNSANCEDFKQWPSRARRSVLKVNVLLPVVKNWCETDILNSDARMCQ